MKFILIDRIISLQTTAGGGCAMPRLVASKSLTLAEEYLADHFPTFPVMPGVLMLQTLVESAAWLLRITDDFQHSVIVLREARNFKYGSFMEPGRSLILTVEAVEGTPGAAEVS